MLKRVRAALVVAALAASALVGVVPASAVTSLREGTDAAAVLFDPLATSQVALVHSIGSPFLTFDYLNSDTYRHADITITLTGKKPVTLKNVGVRLKGQASRYDVKFPMKVKFDAFVPGQKFLGLKRMTLNNMVQDPTFIHEATAYRLYRAAGVPAPRTGYSKVSVEGFYMGLYLNLESIDKVFGKRWYNSTKHIYSGPYNCDVVPGNTCYTASIGDTTRTDLDTAGAVANLHGEQWWNAIQQVSDMNRVISLMATDVFMSNWDGYTDAVQNNHFIHFDDQGKLTVIPWGLDQTFTQDASANLTWDGNGPIFRNWSNHRSTLFDHCIEYAPCHSQLIKEGVRISKLAASIDLIGFKNRVAAKVNPIVTDYSEIHRADPASLVAQQNWIDQFIPARQAVLNDYLATNPPQIISVAIPRTLRAGVPVKLTTGAIWEAGVTKQIQWLRNGTEIAGASGSSYTPTNEDIDTTISVRVTLSKANVADTVINSADQTVMARAFKLAPIPKISGIAKVGKTVSAVAGKWDAGTSLTYQWFRGTTAIDGANSARHLVTSADRGSQLSVRVIGSQTYFVTTSKTSQKTLRVR